MRKKLAQIFILIKYQKRFSIHLSSGNMLIDSVFEQGKTIILKCFAKNVKAKRIFKIVKEKKMHKHITDNL